MSITIRELSERFASLFDFNLPKTRRWAREILPPDPKATRQSGYTRELTNGEAFDIVLGGHLIKALGFLVSEARVIIRDLKPTLKEKGLYPDEDLKKFLKSPQRYYRIHIMRGTAIESQTEAGFVYELREQLEGPVSTEHEDVYKEKYKSEWIAPKGTYPDFLYIRVLEITLLLVSFAAFMTSSEGVARVPMSGLGLKQAHNFLDRVLLRDQA